MLHSKVELVFFREKDLIMPELPEVETFRRYFLRHCLNETIERVEILDETIIRRPEPAIFIQKMTDKKLIATSRIGKYLFIHLNKNGVLLLHFGMTGDLRFNKEEELSDLSFYEMRHDRIRLHFKSKGVLSIISQRKFSRVELWSSINECVESRKLGIDALEIDQERFQELILSSSRPVKAILLDQKRIAGLGNLYADELLFQSGINPLIPGSTLSISQIDLMWKNMKDILKTAVEIGADYGKFPQDFFIRDREIGGICPRCKSPLSRTKVGQRTTLFCPRCQPR